MAESSRGFSNYPDALSQGELYDGYDEEYQCPILDEDRVSWTSHASFEPGYDLPVYTARNNWCGTTANLPLSDHGVASRQSRLAEKLHWNISPRQLPTTQ